MVQTNLELDELLPGINFKMKITRDEFESVLAPQLDMAIAPIQQALGEFNHWFLSVNIIVCDKHDYITQHCIIITGLDWIGYLLVYL